MQALIDSREDLAQRVTELVSAGQTVLLGGASGSGRTRILRRIMQLHVGPVLAGGGLAGLQSLPLMALSRALRLRVPAADPTRAADFVVAAAGRSTLVALDDLELCDHASLEVIALLVGQLPVVLAVADDTARGAALAATLARLPGVVKQSLTPLADDEAVEVARLAYQGRDPGALRSIVRAAGGNPGALLALASDPAAADFRTAVAHRLAALDPPARTALCLLGLLGRPAQAALIGAGLAQAAISSGVVLDRDGWLEARSKLDVEVALAVLPADQRRSLHAAIAVRLPDPGERARHFEQAGDSSAAALAAHEAAATASSPLERTRHLAVSARVAAEPARAQACLGVAMSAADSGDHRLAAVMAAAAGAEQDPRVALIRARAASAIGDFTAALDHLDSLTGIWMSDELEILVGLERARALCVLDPIAAMDAATEAFAAAASDGERARAGAVLGAAQLAAGADGWEATLRSAEVLAFRCRLSDVAYAATMNLCSGLLRHGRPDEAYVIAGDTADEIADSGLASWTARFRAVLLWVEVQARAALSGGLRIGEALLDGALTPALRREVTAQVALAYGDSGRLVTAHAVLEGNASTDDLLGWCAAELAALGGDRRRAAQMAAEVLTTASRWPVPELAAVTAAWAGAPPIVTVANQVPVSGAAAELEALAAFDHPSHAAQLFATAAKRWAGHSRRSVLRCRLAAAMAIAGDQPQAALAELRSLAKDLETEELVLLARHVTKARRHFGDSELPAVATGPRGGTLSRRETEVMAGVAQGLTSVMIAGQLGVAPSTVETQVKSAMRKLGASTRTEAAVLAMQ